MKKISFFPFYAKRNTILAVCACIVLSLSSCSVMLPVIATSNPVSSSKTGTATATNLFGLFWITPDASIATAAANGGITKISTVDIQKTNFLWIVGIDKTIVKGD